MLRKIIAVISGYLLYAVSAVVLFQLSGHAPHSPTTWGFAGVTAMYGIFFAVLGGVITQYISKTDDLSLNIILALMIAVFAGISGFLSTGSHWTQIMSIVLFAPSAFLGGWLVFRNKNS